MGQMTVGLLYGCQAPEVQPKDEDDEEPLYDMIQRFNNSIKAGLLTRKLRVSLESEGKKTLVGVFVAAGGSGEDGAAYFVDDCFPIGQVGKHYSKNIENAKKLWDRFAKYLHDKEGIKLRKPTLWITPCEVA